MQWYGAIIILKTDFDGFQSRVGFLMQMFKPLGTTRLPTRFEIPSGLSHVSSRMFLEAPGVTRLLKKVFKSHQSDKIFCYASF